MSLKTSENNDTPITAPKKRGRKPKGGKIVDSKHINNNTKKMGKENVILHLKCSSNDIKFDFFSDIKYDPNIETVQPYEDNNSNNIYTIIQETEANVNKHSLNVLKNKSPQSFETLKTMGEVNVSNKGMNTDICNKLKSLQLLFHNNNISDKKSACFWCSYDFDNPVIYIPKHKLNDVYEVYGCFCSPECATAYLYNEDITPSFKFERYALMQSLYKSIFNYKDNIKPASDPRFVLEKFFGNLTIEEYRALNRSNQTFMVIDKPITRSLPELYDTIDNTHVKNRFNINIDKNTTCSQEYRLSRNQCEISATKAKPFF